MFPHAINSVLGVLGTGTDKRTNRMIPRAVRENVCGQGPELSYPGPGASRNDVKPLGGPDQGSRWIWTQHEAIVKRDVA